MGADRLVSRLHVPTLLDDLAYEARHRVVGLPRLVARESPLRTAVDATSRLSELVLNLVYEVVEGRQVHDLLLVHELLHSLGLDICVDSDRNNLHHPVSRRLDKLLPTLLHKRERGVQVLLLLLVLRKGSQACPPVH